MRMFLPVAAVALAGCSARSPAPMPTATPSANRSQPSSTPVATEVRPGELRTFGDWAVGCDNTALCTMASLGSEAGEFTPVTMQLLRQPGPDGQIDIALDTTDEGRPVSPRSIEIDGRALPLPTLNGPTGMQVARAMANAQTLTIPPSDGHAALRLSLAGAAAALRWIDAEQGRAGTVTAIVARGSRPAASVPERRTAPVIAAALPTGTTLQPTPAQRAAMNRQAACEMPAGVASSPELAPLGDGETLVILPCSAGAYNVIAALFVLDGSAVRAAQVDTPAGFAASGADPRTPVASVVNARWKDGELTSYAKGRGLGDCGVRQTFVWDGERLRLSEQAEMRECRGNPQPIVTWRAQVVRR